MADNNNPTKVVTGMVRFSYLNVFEPRAMSPGDEPKYSTAILIPKKDKATLAKIEAAVKAAFELGKTKHKLLPNCKTPLHDGDEEKPDDENYAGMMYLNANNKSRPGVVDADRNSIIDKEEVYSGCWGKASLNFYAYSTGNKGIGAGLNGIQKLDEGDRLGGGGFDVNDFGSDDSNDMM